MTADKEKLKVRSVRKIKAGLHALAFTVYEKEEHKLSKEAEKD